MNVDNKVEKFFKKFPPRPFYQGEILINADEDPSGIFYLKSGLVREYSISPEGKELVVNIFKPGSFFPMSWAINGTKNTFFFESYADSVVRIAPREEVIVFIKENKDVLLDLLARVYSGTDGLLSRLTNLMGGDARLKVINELSITAKRFGKDSSYGIALNISQSDLASRIGLTRETVSREMNRLKKSGLLKVAHKRVILDRSKFLD